MVILLIASLTQTIVVGQKKSDDKKKKYEPPKVQTPVDYRGTGAPAGAQPNPQTLADVKWFEVFKDEKLQELIREALIYNYDLRESVARIDLARANLGLTRSEQFPTI